MPRRKGNVIKIDRALEKRAAKEQREVAAAREIEQMKRNQRNLTWHALFFAHGYSQAAIAAVANEGLSGPSDPNWVTEDTVQKALTRLVAASSA